jgi:hypothetical protein
VRQQRHKRQESYAKEALSIRPLNLFPR